MDDETLLEGAAKGWESQRREYSYWVPATDVEGTMPKELEGTFFRNGPGINEVYGIRLKHPIDGDGMICAVTFSKGRVHFRSRFVQTRQHQREQVEKAFVFPGQMGSTSKKIVEKNALELAKGFLMGAKSRFTPYRDPSNTNVFYWGGKLLSCYETFLPHSIDPNTLRTLGPDNLNGTLPLRSFAAHFRHDPVKDLLVTLSLRAEVPSFGVPGGRGKPSSLMLNEYNREWNLVQSQVHHIPGLNYAHDFILTPSYYILHMSPFVKISSYLFFKIALGHTSPGEAMRHHKQLPSRFVVIPRDPNRKDEIQFFDTDRFHIFHFGNAKEEDLPRTSSMAQNCRKKVSFNAVCLGEKMKMEFEKGVWLANASTAPGQLREFDIEMQDLSQIEEPCQVAPRTIASSTSTVTTIPYVKGTIVEPRNVEFPAVHPYRHGLPCRYVYLMGSADVAKPLPFTTVIKYSSHPREPPKIWKSYGVIGEPCFVPRAAKRQMRAGEEYQEVPDEDDGWVIVQLYNPAHHCTEFVVLDAREMRLICAIHLRHHVPYGFHGTFTPRVFVSESTVEEALLSKL